LAIHQLIKNQQRILFFLIVSLGLGIQFLSSDEKERLSTQITLEKIYIFQQIAHFFGELVIPIPTIFSKEVW
jgi:hypothetical protein